MPGQWMLLLSKSQFFQFGVQKSGQDLFLKYCENTMVYRTVVFVDPKHTKVVKTVYKTPQYEWRPLEKNYGV